jgi:hypothetical protein
MLVTSYNTQGPLGTVPLLVAANGFYMEGRVSHHYTGVFGADLWLWDYRQVQNYLAGADINPGSWPELDLFESTNEPGRGFGFVTSALNWTGWNTNTNYYNFFNFDPTVFHTFGVLVVPMSRNGGTGFIQFYLDGAPLSGGTGFGSFFTWTAGSTMSFIENGMFVMFTSTAITGLPLYCYIDYIFVATPP